jgi:oxygen-dependent protoporphyrinogen oxidase
LTDILTSVLGDGVVSVDESVERVSAGKSVPYRVLSDRGELDADLVILATPAYASASMLSDLDAYMSHLLDDIPYSSMTVVCFGYERDRISHDLNGFGYLIPKEERMNTLGTLWDSSIFEGRAPEGMVLLRSMMGGACFPGYIGLSDDEVRQRVTGDLKTIMGITAEPAFVRIFRHEKAIPQYIVGHNDRVTALEEKLKEHPGLFLTGNSYRGIGLNDCVATANRTVDDAVAYLQQR